ncbi:DUF4037 domain-containing protein [Halobacillus yeomjeoni]|uniref:DUF4037 domain-containing protein n=1 Tax=Halobacillus yeomjeoni TaxID=311194 RepID=UPI001CD66AF7|nr:DUF4037 domain-containing protein [Halobacillus yeomjeoni]MCA0983424.1 DUF4037 domain-containing protein [Halobacillus yeomjeoni]
MNLKELAEETAAIYTQNPNIDAVLLAGSVGRGWDDDFSDIELHIFWSVSPSDEERKAPIYQLKGELLSYYPYEDEEWSESYRIEPGIKLEISNFLTTTIDKVVHSVVEDFNIDYDYQCIVSSIVDGEGLYGHEIIDEFKKKSSIYPNELAYQMVQTHMDLGNRWNNRYALLHRKDWLMLYDVINQVQKNLFGVLFGLNHLYVQHPSFKWMNETIQKMNIKPLHFEKRLEGLYQGNPERAIVELETLYEDVAALTAVQFPKKEDLESKDALS